LARVSPLSPSDATLIRVIVPRELASFPRLRFPRRLHHPAGFSLTGAPVGTFARGTLLIAGRKVLGPRYRGSSFYEDVEKDLAFGIIAPTSIMDIPPGRIAVCNARWLYIPCSSWSRFATPIAGRWRKRRAQKERAACDVFRAERPR
jgi:hypothetical protein